MPLSEDSRALLALLLGRGKSYADIAGLLAIDEAEVRKRAAKALAEVDESVPPPDPGLADYLLGQDDPIARAEMRTRLEADPHLSRRAETLADQLRLLVPGARLPGPGTGSPAPGPDDFDPPAARHEPQPPQPDSTRQPDSTGAQQPKPRPAQNGLAAITGHQRRLIAMLLGGALLAAVVILLASGVIGGSGDDDSPSGEPAPTVAVLQPVGDEQGSGQVQFGFAGTTLAANLQFSDLRPNTRGQGYVIWLHGATGAFPIYAASVGQEGVISGQIDLNEAVICLIASDFFPNLRLSRTPNRAFTRALNQVRVDDPNDVRLPEYTGTTVLEGPISMPQEAKDTIVPICNGTAAQTPPQPE